jgi:hypothetical protein
LLLNLGWLRRVFSFALAVEFGIYGAIAFLLKVKISPFVGS